MDKYEYINELLKENNLSLLDLTKYYDSNKEIIDSFKSIFDEENLDAKYIINTIPVILNPEKAKKIQEFINEGEIPSVDYNQYKLQILTALLFNNEFFVYACNWCSYTLYQAEKTIQVNKNVISFSWESLNIDNQQVYAQAAAIEDVVQIYPVNSDIESNFLVYWYEQEKTMHFIYIFDENYKEKEGCIKIEFEGLFDLEGNEISEIIIDEKLNEINEISKKIQADFTKNFKISRVLVRK